MKWYILVSETSGQIEKKLTPARICEGHIITLIIITRFCSRVRFLPVKITALPLFYPHWLENTGINCLIFWEKRLLSYLHHFWICTKFKHAVTCKHTETKWTEMPFRKSKCRCFVNRETKVTPLDTCMCICIYFSCMQFQFFQEQDTALNCLNQQMTSCRWGVREALKQLCSYLVAPAHGKK